VVSLALSLSKREQTSQNPHLQTRLIVSGMQAAHSTNQIEAPKIALFVLLLVQRQLVEEERIQCF